MPYDVQVYHRKADMLAPPELANVHPLGKSPVITVTAPDSTQSVVLAETGFIIQYLCDHFGEGKNLVPKRWKDGQENKVLGETEAWLRYQYLLHYVEGSLMPNMVMYLVLSGMSHPRQTRRPPAVTPTHTTNIRKSPTDQTPLHTLLQP